MRFVAVALSLTLLACNAPPATPAPARQRAAVHPTALLEDVQKRTFLFFWETTNPENGLVPDRWPTPSFSSIAAVGFGLTAYGVGAERGWITSGKGAQRTLATVQSMLAMKQGPEPQGVSGYKGFFYHFLDMKTAERFKTVELST